MKKLEDISINEYVAILKAGTDTETINFVNSEFSKLIGESAGGFDLGLFQLQKDLLLFQCRVARAVFDFDNQQAAIYQKKVESLREEVERKTKKKEKTTPYRSFVNWVLSVEKYLSFSLNRENDLLYFVEATKQMLNFYDAQKKQYEENKAKK